MTDQDQNDADEQLLRDLNSSPINPLPGVVWLLVLAVLGVEAVLSAAGYGLIGGPQGVGWRLSAIQRFGFSSGIQGWMLETRQFPPQHLLRYVTFPFIHGSPMHALFGVVLLAALGKMVGERFGALRFLVLALVVPIVAAAIFGLILGDDQLGWLFGAMPMVFALVGGMTWLRWRDAGGDRDKQRRAFALIAALMGARLAFGLIAETGPAWIAELSAFGLGFAASALVLGPGSWQRLRAKIRA
ncbi:rhomboid family intramembrane serine protease [Pararhodobacter zhoushanensis]|uniref:rhomboid family intramembrane serine protease n=1 Tax=Pararhodobacter zhoushanensis TaxID=2479545 RepID=UPI000F8E7081|nr:rhomboid family intramembrane serine protease [Pararhodobacter zhoushanensis]